MLPFLLIVLAVGGMVIGFLLSVLFFRPKFFYKRLFRRVACDVFSQVVGKTPEELLTSDRDLLRRFGASVNESPSSNGKLADEIVSQLWIDFSLKIGKEEEKARIESRYWLCFWGLIGTVIILTTIVGCTYCLLEQKQNLAAGLIPELVPVVETKETSIKTQWKKP